MAVVAAPLPDLAAFARLHGFEADALDSSVRAALEALLAANGALACALEEARNLADRDPLVATLNRRAFLRELDRCISFVDRYRAPAAVLFLDLDGFKAINDGFGHGAGDAVLRHVGRFLLTHVRDSDAVGRIGGDEFGVILAHTGRDEAHAKAVALAQGLVESPCLHEGVAHRVGASIGVHLLTGPEAAEDALARADEAMYAIKKPSLRRA